MPTLNWIGKEKVINHHLDVPFRTLKAEYAFGDTEAAKDNFIIHGDNLEALKALLPQYEGKVKVVCIDPPYNTGNESWVYNDNVNDPKIKKWLGQVVGKEGEDLSRHDKWLCMMYPRLKLLHRLLRDDGVICVNIDDEEVIGLRAMLDEIFGRSNFIAQFVWKSRVSEDARAVTGVSIDHEYVLCYSKKIGVKFQGVEKDLEKFSNPDNDPRGPWRSADLTGLATIDRRPNLHYAITDPITGIVHSPPEKGWRFEKTTMQKKIQEGRILFPKEPSGRPRQKLFVNEMDSIYKAITSLITDVSTADGTKILKELFWEQKNVFDFPKPPQLYQKLISQIAVENSPDSIILDSFAGSGTTAHAVLKLNKTDGGNRRFILIEMEDYAETITAERVRRVISGYGPEDKKVPGTGGGFSFLSLGPTVFTADGKLNPDVEEAALRQYLWYAETKTALPKGKNKHPYFLGSCRGVSYYFFYKKGEETTLGYAFLKTITERDDQYVIYADACGLDAEFLNARSIQFKKIPRDVPRY